MELNKIKDLNNFVKDFLLFGPDVVVDIDAKSHRDCHKSDVNNVGGILEKSKMLLSQLSSQTGVSEDDQKTFISNLFVIEKSVLTYAQQLEIHSSPIIEMGHNYIFKLAKLHNLTLAHAMKQLILQSKTCGDDFSLIPDKILIIIEDGMEMPSVLVGPSKLRLLVLETVKVMKEDLLRRFHRLLEEHLVSVEENMAKIESQSEDNEVANGALLWEKFILLARDLLLSFSLVCILPALLTETNRSIVIERFQASLDDALTPMWGRFHFHLQLQHMKERSEAERGDEETNEDHSAKRQSMQQIFWTFKYAKNFVQLLVGLSDRLTDCAAVRRLSTAINGKNAPSNAKAEAASTSANDPQHTKGGKDVDATLFRLAGRTHVTQKATTFMRAFVAVVLEKYFLPYSYQSISTTNWSRSSVDKSFFGRFVEEILQLDDLLVGLPHGGTKEDSGDGGLSRDQAATFPVSMSERTSVISVVANRRDVFAEWLLIDHTYFVGNLEILLSKPKSVFSFSFGQEKEEEKDAVSESRQRSLHARYHRCFNGVYRCVELFTTACKRYVHLSQAQQLLVSQIILEPLLIAGLSLLLFRIRSNPTIYRATMKSGGGGAGRKLVSSAQPPEEVMELLDSLAYFQTCLSQAATSAGLFVGDPARMKTRWASVHQTIPKFVLFRDSGDIPPAKKASFSLLDLLEKTFLTTESVQKVIETVDVSALSIDGGEKSDRSLIGCIAFTKDVATTLANVIAACLAEQL